MSRSVHPGAWWLWALALGLTASLTTNPLVLGLIMAVAVLVVVACRVPGATTASLRLYLIMAGLVLVARLIFRVVFAAQVPGAGPVVLPLPTVHLGTSSLALFGPVHLGTLLSALADGMRLAALIICVGAAACLASPKRTLAALPGALRHVGTAVVVALTVFPQLASAVVRVRRTAALRGPAPNRRAGALRVVFPVLADALDRSLELAAALEARGYGRAAAPGRAVRGGRTAALLVGTSLLAGGAIAWTGALPLPTSMGAVALGLGTVAVALAWHLMGQGHRRSRYQIQPWDWTAWLVVGSALSGAAGVALLGLTTPGALHPTELVWPALTWPAVCGLAMAASPAWLIPTATRRTAGHTSAANLAPSQPGVGFLGSSARSTSGFADLEANA